MSIYIEFLIVFLLIIVNGLFALSEFALISSRRAGLALLAKKKVKGARKAVELMTNPNDFLPSIQIGITLVSMLVGVFSGAGTAQTLKGLLAHIPVIGAYAGILSLGLVVIVITYLTLIIGELVPKHLALSAPEKISAKIAKPLSIFSILCFPLTRFLALSSDVILWLLHVPPHRSKITEEELKLLLAESAEEGILNFDERDMIGRILRLADKKVRATMTSRSNVAFIDLSDSATEIISALKATIHSRFIVCDGSIDNVIGIIPVKDILNQLLNDTTVPTSEMIGSLIRKNIRKPTVVPDTLSALSALEKLKREPLGMALVLDEYGSFEGIVTAVDMLEAIVGDPDDIATEPTFFAITTDKVNAENRPKTRSVMDGTTPIDEIKALLELPDLPAEGTYHTLGGFLLALLKRIPQKGDTVLFAGYCFEIVEMDGRRVGKVRLAPTEQEIATQTH